MLVNCSECDQQVSDKAMACPSCGAPLAEESDPKPKTPPSAGWKDIGIMFALGCLVTIPSAFQNDSVQTLGAEDIGELLGGSLFLLFAPLVIGILVVAINKWTRLTLRTRPIIWVSWALMVLLMIVGQRSLNSSLPTAGLGFDQNGNASDAMAEMALCAGANALVMASYISEGQQDSVLFSIIRGEAQRFTDVVGPNQAQSAGQLMRDRMDAGTMAWVNVVEYAHMCTGIETP